MTVVVFAEVEAGVIEELGKVILCGAGCCLKQVGAVCGGDGGDGIDPDDSEQRRPAAERDLHDPEIYFGEEVIKPSQPEEQRDKDGGEEEVENHVVRLKDDDLADELCLVKNTGLEKAHNGDVPEREEDQQAENIDDNKLQPVLGADR